MSRRIEKTLSRNSELDIVVQRVHDEENDFIYVIKRIKRLDTPLYRTIFEKEAQALMRLKACENVVRIFDYEVKENRTGDSEGIISMEFVNGIPLSKIIERIPSNAVRYQLVRQLINAMRHAHQNSIIHRDINPDNILITEGYELKLIDFGIAKIRGMMMQTGTTYQFATMGYSAPEVTLHSENASEQSDIYSLGAVILFLFTGSTPPSPDQIGEKISNCSGIDVKLREILQSMCAYDQNARYETVDDCELALSALFQRYCGTNENYYFAVPSQELDQMKYKNMISKRFQYDETLKDILPKQFASCSLSIYRRDDVTIYRFDGISMYMESIYTDNIFNVIKIDKLDAYIRERRKRFALEINGICIFINSHLARTQNLKNNHNEILCNRIDDFQHDLTSQRNVDREYDDQYGIWRKFIEAMIKDAAQNALKINYIGYEKNEGELLFRLDEQCLPEDSFNQETTFIIEETNTRNGKPKLSEIGAFLEYRDDACTMVLKPTGKLPRLSKQGQFSVDYRREIKQYRRQEAAMDEFRRSETVSSGNLKSIFVGVEQPGSFRRLERPSFFNDNLDFTQKRAVQKIVESKDISLVQGPPGTGKTNVLVEVVRQIIKENSENPASNRKILIVSQAHSAVDKVLSDLKPYLMGVTTIRVGSEDDIDPCVNEHFGLYHSQRNWEEKSVMNCDAELKKRLDKEGIILEDFKVLANALETLGIANNSEGEQTLCQEIITNFEIKYKVMRDDLFLKQCLIMEQWCRHLIETSELGEYYIKNAMIVAGTCSGFISNTFVRDTMFDYVIVDEAAKATLPEIMVALVKAHKVVLVGDHKQLPPVFNRDALSRNADYIRIPQLENTGFGKLFDLLPDTCKETLSTQYRMHPCIGDLISILFYDGEVQNGVSATEREISVPFFSGKAIKWMSTSTSQSNRHEQQQASRSGGYSFTNPLEVTVLQRCLFQLDTEMAQCGHVYSIGIITPYSAQAELIRKRLQHSQFTTIKFDVNTVDAFQGSQRDIIIYSTVRSSGRLTIGFLKEQARLNVSFSRAMRGLVIIGDAQFLSNPRIKDNRFPEILQYIKENPEWCTVTKVEGV